MQPKMSTTGVPVQTMALGACSCPGCPYPKRVEGGKVHDYCSRTCAQKHSQMKSSFHQQKMALATQAGDKNSCVHHLAIYIFIFFVAKAGSQASPAAPVVTGPTPSQQLPQQVQMQPKMCKKCNQQPANPGRSWCETCFRQNP